VKKALAAQQVEDDAKAEEEEKKDVKVKAEKNVGVTASEQGEAAFDQEKGKEKAAAEAEDAKDVATKIAADKKEGGKGQKVPYNECTSVGLSRGECFTVNMPDKAYDLAQKHEGIHKKAQKAVAKAAKIQKKEAKKVAKKAKKEEEDSASDSDSDSDESDADSDSEDEKDE
jgi:hypothetical protein